MRDQRCQEIYKDLKIMASRKEKVGTRCPMAHTRIGEL